MCGRYAISRTRRDLETDDLFKNVKTVGMVFDDLPRYNASPRQKLPIVAVRYGERRAETMQWWLLPHWAKKDEPQFSTFNAKAETLEKSRLFAPYFKSSRCLVPADAFYEWKKLDSPNDVGRSAKQPMCIRMKDESLFMFAGLFSVWIDENGSEHPTFTIITTVPNELLAPIHNRMPVILPRSGYDEWLDPENNDVGQLKKLLVPFPSGKMKAYPVSTLVNNPKNNSPQCLKPV